MEKQNSKNTSLNELRQDLVTGDWVVISTIRGKRPDEFKNKDEKRIAQVSEADCLFCDPAASGQEKDVLIYNIGDGDWSLRVFPNKYPAFSAPFGGKSGKIRHKEEGPYFWMDGVGYNEVIITRDHYKHIGQLSPLAAAEVIDAYQTRFIDLMNKKGVNYIDIFHNHGEKAGAHIFHPHSQLAAIPVISPYIRGELDGAENFYRTNKQCVYCTMIEWEKEARERIVFENEEFVAFCPFASRAAFEIWIMPKKHKPYFERITDKEKIDAGEALQSAVSKISKALDNPDFNFYIHTSPCDGQDYPHFHWHIEILPLTAIWAGFELSTGIEISTIQPEAAAEYLRGQN